MNEQIKAARKQLGGFFKERREQLGQTLEDVAEFIGITVNTLKGIETGRFAWDIDLHLKICSALGIKPYFSFEKDPTEEDFFHTQKKANKNDFHGYYISENILLYPDQLAIIKLTYPRLFLSFNYSDSLFLSYEDWKANHTTLQWLDGEKPSDDEIEYILTECWNFLALDEKMNDENEN